MNDKQYIIDNLDKALKEKWITVYYQPIVRGVNRRVCDEEALARWIDPVKGFLSPADFIPILEESKLIYKVDLYILEQVLEKMKYMASHGFFMVSQSIQENIKPSKSGLSFRQAHAFIIFLKELFPVFGI